MEIYVDKIPGSCKTCNFQCYGECLNGADILNCDYNTMKCHLKKNRPQDCPLKSLAEHDKKLIESVCDKIRLITRAKGIFGQSCKDMNYLQFNEILDQIKEVNNE